MTTTTLAALDQPIRGTAQLDADGTLTIGAYADASPAGWPLVAGDNRARHALIIGTTRSGVTCLLRSVLDGAAAAGASTQLIDLTGGLPDGGVHPSVIDVDAARDVLARTVVLARARLTATDRSTQQLLVLAVDGLHRLTADRQCTEHLADLLRIAAKARIAVIAAGPDATLITTGGDDIRATLAADTVVVLHTRQPTGQGTVPGLGAVPAIPNQAAGVGYLPRQRPAMPFRAWLP